MSVSNIKTGITVRRIDEENTSTFYLEGAIDENAKFDKLLDRPKQNIIINFKAVEKINSVGVKRWIEILEKLPKSSNLLYTECSVPVVTQMNMVTNFKGQGKIASFYAPYYCPQCDIEYKYLLNIQEHFLSRVLRAPAVHCVRCQTPLQFDELEVDYLQIILQD